MARLITKHVFQGGIEQVFTAISSYDKYIKYLDMVSDIVVHPPEAKGSVCKVEYHVQVIKDIQYTLHMFHDAPKKVSWTLADSNFMKENSGSWSLKALSDSETQATYSVDLKPKGFVPQVLIDQVTKASIPSLMASMQKLIDSLNKKKKAASKKK